MQVVIEPGNSENVFMVQGAELHLGCLHSKMPKLFKMQFGKNSVE
jgi:hypothetical protein